MENREQQILSEIKSMMSSIRIQLEKLDAKMAELQQVVDPEELEAMPIDLDIDETEMMAISGEVVADDDLPFAEEAEDDAVAELEPEPVAEPEPEEQVEEEPEAEALPEPMPEPEIVPEPAPVQTPEPEPMPTPEPEPAPEPTPEPEPQPVPVVEEDDDDLPLFAEPKPLFEAAIESPKAKKAVIDVMTDKQAWRTDIVGSPVRDLLSAISLNDRVQFINVLFQGDPVVFQQTRAKINAMTSLDEVVEYVTANFNWDMSSQVVYRFMMAVRRKVQA